MYSRFNQHRDHRVNCEIRLPQRKASCIDLRFYLVTEKRKS